MRTTFSTECPCPIPSCQPRFPQQRARLDDWTTGRLDDWTTGRLDDWTTGRLDDWTTGRLDDWTTGRLDDWIFPARLHDAFSLTGQAGVTTTASTNWLEGRHREHARDGVIIAPVPAFDKGTGNVTVPPPAWSVPVPFPSGFRKLQARTRRSPSPRRSAGWGRPTAGRSG